MKQHTLIKQPKALAVGSLLLVSTSGYAVETDIGTFTADFRLRYEAVDQENALKDADALTLRTLLNFKTKSRNHQHDYCP